MLQHGMVQQKQLDILYPKHLVLVQLLYIVNYVHQRVMYEL